MDVAARIGWLTRGVLFLIVSTLVARLPTTGTDRRVDKHGAFAAVFESRLGGWALGALVVGMVGFAGWRSWSAVRGTGESAARRLSWAGSALVYVALSVAAARILLDGRSSGGDEERAATAEVLSWPGGALIVGAVGVVLLLVAGNHARKAVQERFLGDVDITAVPRRLRAGVRVLGVAGLIGRAVTWALVGWFVVRAAVQHDSSEPVGLDHTLRVLVGEPWGPAVLWLACAGLAAYGLFCLVTARWPDPEPDS